MSKADEGFAARIVAGALGIAFSPGKLPIGDWGEADCYCHVENGLCVVLEAERGQKHPSTNVAKLWPWLEEDSDRRVLLIQAFLRPNVIPVSRRRLALWLGNRMQRDLPEKFIYRPITIDGDTVIEGLPELRQALASVRATRK